VTFSLLDQWHNTTTLYVWRTVFGWDGMTQTNSTFFESLGPISVANGQFSLTVNPDEMYTITTLSTGAKADIPTPPPSQPFPTVYADDFESYNISSEAQYFADQAGMCDGRVGSTLTTAQVHSRSSRPPIRRMAR
jgi:galactosylceramidase